MTQVHSARFGRVLTAMATPFGPRGELDVEAAGKLAQYLVANGSDGLVLTGSTGEGSVLSDDERISIWEKVRSVVDVPIIVGSTSNDTAHSVELTGRATELGIDGILAVTPYYNRPSQAGIEQHFRAVAEATALPVLLYDIPARSVRRIARETMLRLASDLDNIVGVKDASGDPASTARLLAEAPPGFECYSGDDALTMSLLAVGAVGTISVAAHWCGNECARMIEAFFAGDLAEAIAINQALIPSYVFESSDDAPNPIPTKAMMRCLGVSVGQCRLPLGVAPQQTDDQAKVVLANLDSWRDSYRS